ncbi:MAG: PQQ-dependent sugar dehydrogenase, partial [Planctomycetia bacterium]|nr:PQQ-dependent sugar dehydrogenase [Planctomycetia bacterium]
MRRYLPLSLLLGSLACTVLFGPVAAQDDPNYKPYAPKVAAANDDWKKAIQRIRVPASTRVDLWAAEPLLTQPVAFCIDEKNRIFVSETFRLHKGVTDVRNFPAWLEGDVASRTVADRIALMQKHLGKKAESWAVDHERIRLLEDTKGTGQADRSVVFADGFNRLEDGLGAGLLARNGTVWYACIPNLWRLRDTKGTGKADERQALHTGYGVHIAFIGHDLHGPRLGPDGKLYFSCGDRGLHVETAGKVISNPDSGAVLRCNPDGSELELVATGLRNPQGIVFDQFGNLFTGDNNADGGDRARWVQIVEGGDSGWRLSYQSMNFPTGLGPWNAERLWDAKNPTPAPYVVPPITNLGDGPSGVCYDPGVTALPERYRQHFFLCDFRGGSGNSGIRSFALKPKGASFELTDAHECVWSVLPTDVHFGTDGALYLADWVEG